jgi:hypothetical protein
MRIHAHGIGVEIPAGWEARLFRHPGGEPTLHAASFALPAHDGEFGSHATAQMPPGGMFLALTEYRPGGGLQAGRGLFAPAPPNGSIARNHFHPRTLLVAREGQEGLQRFFTANGRPFCLYVVLDRRTAHTAVSHPQLAALNALLGSLTLR